MTKETFDICIKILGVTSGVMIMAFGALFFVCLI